LTETEIKRQLRGNSKMSMPVFMEVLSDTYGWTPRQIEKQRISDLLSYWEVHQTKKQLKEAEIKKNKPSI